MNGSTRIATDPTLTLVKFNKVIDYSVRVYPCIRKETPYKYSKLRRKIRAVLTLTNINVRFSGVVIIQRKGCR